ncbi:MAG: hypothetical protein GVY15_04070 [Bacteroidetes bacterium]|jgi:hypothetical protein|nr:hypothetical protein [Bacteroidota bacterium]
MLNPDYRDILFAFADAGVEYLLVGAYALAAHGQPRATGDIDLWVRPTSANAERVMQALNAFGAPLARVNAKDFEASEVVFQIGVSPRRIDILTSIASVDFESAWADRLEIKLEGIVVPVLSREHLVQNKKAVGRPQDLADVDRLSGMNSEQP